MVKRVCKECATEFLCKESHLRRTKNAGHFCSHRCKSVYGSRVSALKTRSRIQKECKTCGKTYEVKLVHSASKYCSMPCSAQSQKTKFAGANNPNFRGKTRICILCGAATRNKMHCSMACRLLDQNVKTPTLKAIRASAKYQQWRRAVLERDGATCVLCGSTDSPHVDHIKPFIEIITEERVYTRHDAYDCARLWDTRNGRVLCSACHRKTGSYARSWSQKKISNAPLPNSGGLPAGRAARTNTRGTARDW